MTAFVRPLHVNSKTMKVANEQIETAPGLHFAITGTDVLFAKQTN